MPPIMVYMTTPTGSRKHAAAVGMPVKEVTTAEPPVRSFEQYQSPSPHRTGHEEFPHHGSDQNVRHQAKYNEHQMGIKPVPSPDDFQEGMCVGCTSLQFDSQRCKE